LRQVVRSRGPAVERLHVNRAWLDPPEDRREA
jgi:hypothetical protein